MKKVLIIITVLLSSLFVSNVFAEDSETKLTEDELKNESIGNLLGKFAPEKVVKPGNAEVETGLKDIIDSIVTNLSYILGIFAIGAIVYGGIIMVISAGEDEKVSKGKDIIKWSLVGFLGLVSAAGLIKIVISVMYGLSSV